MSTARGNPIHAAVFNGIGQVAGMRSFTYAQAASRAEEAYRGERQALSAPERLGLRAAILDYWNALLRTGVLAFGGADGWNPLAFHLTATGRKTLAQFGRDPINPDGYMLHLKHCATLDPISESYVKEALHTYQAGCHKATAVLVGTGAEGMILHLRDVLVGKLRAAGRKVPKDMDGWRIKNVCDEIGTLLEDNQKFMPAELSATFDTHWQGFTSHIRAIRNKAGHPNNIDPVSPESVHSALLIFPEFAQLVAALEKWAAGHAW